MNDAWLNCLLPRVAAISVAAWLCGSASAQVIPCRYEVVTFDGPMCGDGEPAPVFVNGINDTDPPTIVGYWFCPPLGSDKPFYWNEASGLVTLPLPVNASGASCAGINNVPAKGIPGHIAGTMSVPGGNRAFLYDGAEFLNLGTLPGDLVSSAQAINDAMQICGTSFSPITGPLQAFFWDKQMMGFDASFGPASVSLNIGKNGEVVGWMGNSQTTASHAFLFSNGTLIDLGTVPGGSTATATAITTAGEVCIYGSIGSTTQSFILMDGIWTSFAIPAGCSLGIVRDMNDSLVAVGAGCGPRVWQNGVVRSLNDLIPSDPNIVSLSVNRIGNSGYIAGTAFKATPPLNQLGVVLTPVMPAPGDTDCDDDVDVVDLLNVINSWSDSGGFADLNGDEIVNLLDLVQVIDNWSAAT